MIVVSPLDFVPEDWKTDIIVLRGGGRDSRGNPITPEEIPRKKVLIAPRTTDEPQDWSEVTQGTMGLFDQDRGDGFHYKTTDIIRVPEGARMAGDWAIAGRPGEWPLGVEVPLVKT